MNPYQRWSVAAVLGGALLTVAGATMQTVDDGRNPPAKDWTHYGGDWTSARFSTLDQINVETVKTLGAAWTMTFDAAASTRAAPVVKDGMMFISAGSRLYALNAKTGEKAWTWRPAEKAPARLEAANIGDLLNAGYGIPGPQGVSLGEGLVFVGLMDGHVAALRQQTGEVVWVQQIGYTPPKTGQSVSGTPAYAAGIVFAGLADADWAFRGKVAALDAKTGKQFWEFYTIPGPGEPGHETWPSDPKYKNIWKQGGAGVWHAPAVDPDLGLVYFVTGNGVPMFGGEARKGDNLYTASVLAFDMKTGKLRWHYQVVHHDLWDADIALPPVLYETRVNGRPQKAIAAMRADGYLFHLDRETGRPVFPIEERPVRQDLYNNTARTQPFPVGADSLAPDCSTWREKIKPPFELDCSGFVPPFLNKHNVIAPNVPVAGVIRVTPISYSAQTGYFYAQGTGAVGRARRISSDPWFRGSAPNPPGVIPPSVNVLAAFDGKTNKIVWKKELPPGPLGTSGPLSTAGGLVFRGDPNGNFEAYNAATGDRLWQFQTGAGGARGAAISYSVDSEQYVALAMGTALWAFKIGGTVPPQTPPRGGGRVGAAEETDKVETSTLVQSAERGVGRRYVVDEHAFNPIVAKVSPGTTVTFTNNGQVVHTIVAQDGAWSTGSLVTAESDYVKFDKPGTYPYHCKEHPWASGRVLVE